MEDLVVNHGLRQRRVCHLLGFDRSVGRYKRKEKNDKELKNKIISIAHERRRFGYRRIGILLKRVGIKVDHKRVYRLYRSGIEGYETRRQKKSLRIEDCNRRAVQT